MIWRDRPRSGASHQLNSPGSMLILSRGPTPKQIRMFFGENGNLVQYRLTMVNAYYLTMCYHNKHTITLRMYIYIHIYILYNVFECAFGNPLGILWEVWVFILFQFTKQIPLSCTFCTYQIPIIQQPVARDHLQKSSQNLFRATKRI